jgi:hypothetical protein
VAAASVVLAPLVATGSMRDDEVLVAAVAMALLVFPLVGVALLLPWAAAVLAATVLVAAEHGDLGTGGIAVCAGLVLLVAECASATGDLAPLARIERRLALRVVVRILVEAVAAGALAAAVVASGSLGIRTSLGTLTVGLVATVGLVGLVALLLGQRRTMSRSEAPD